MADKHNEPPALYLMRRRQLLQGAAASALVAGILPGLSFAQEGAPTEITPATPLPTCRATRP